MNWRDPPPLEHYIRSWTTEHEYARRKTCAHCGYEIAGRYYRKVFANKLELVPRYYHADCA